MDNEHFKQCPGCNQWLSLQDILTNEEIRPLGLVLEDSDYDNGLFYFQHEDINCRSSFVIPASWFTPLVGEPIPAIVKTGTEKCEGRCLKINDWVLCQNDCYHAPFRRFLIRLIANRKMAIKST